MDNIKREINGQFRMNWYLRSFDNSTRDWVAKDVMGHSTHVTILFHNQSLLVIRIFHKCQLYVNQILGFQRLPTYRAVHCLVLNGREQKGFYIQWNYMNLQLILISDLSEMEIFALFFKYVHFINCLSYKYTFKIIKPLIHKHVNSPRPLYLECVPHHDSTFLRITLMTLF
jgi:hypothetical protein